MNLIKTRISKLREELIQTGVPKDDILKFDAMYHSLEQKKDESTWDESDFMEFYDVFLHLTASCRSI